MAKRKTVAKKGRKNRKTRRNLLKRGGGWRQDILRYTGFVDRTAKHREKEERDEKDRIEYEKRESLDDAINLMEENIKIKDVILPEVMKIYEKMKKKLDELSNMCAGGSIRNSAINSKITDLNVELNALVDTPMHKLNT